MSTTRAATDPAFAIGANSDVSVVHASGSTVGQGIAFRANRGLRSTSGLRQFAIAQAAGLIDSVGIRRPRQPERPTVVRVRGDEDFTCGLRATGRAFEAAGSPHGRPSDLRGMQDTIMLPRPGDGLAPIALGVHGLDRSGIRRMIGARDDEVLVALLPGPDGSMDARWFGFIVGVLLLAHGGIRGVVPADAWDLRRSHLLHRVARTSDPLIVSEVPTLLACAASDVAVVDPSGIMLGAVRTHGGACRAMIAGTLAGGVPVVMHEHLDVHGFVDEAIRSRCVLASRGGSRIIELLHAMCSDPAHRADVARHASAALGVDRVRSHNGRAMEAIGWHV